VKGEPIIFNIEDAGLWGDAIRNRKPTMVNDYGAPHASKRGLPEGHVKITSYLGIPVFSGDRIVAASSVANKEEPYTDADVRELTVLTQSVWQIVERKRGEREIQRLNEELKQQVEAQRLSIQELSTPAIPLWDEVVVLPLVGVVDTARAQQVIENLLEAVVRIEARVAILDVTGVPVIDTHLARHTMKTVAAARMLGAEVIVTGIGPDTAQTLAALQVDTTALETCGTLRAGIREALRRVGKQVVSVEEGTS
jgi:anti-anti-sigma regulatory factor